MITLVELWLDFFEKKIFSEFNVKFSSLESDSTLSPLVYTFLKYKQIIPKPREVIESPDLLKNCDEKIKMKWLFLKRDIQSGKDINKFMSKKNLEWKDKNKNTVLDYLYITTGVSHLHLRKNKKGGIGNELVFGIFQKDKFYALKIGNHHDLYKLENLKLILENYFPEIDFLEMNISIENFRRFANDVNLQPAFIYNKEIPQEYYKELNLINYNIDKDSYRVPFLVYCAYENEISYIEQIDELPFDPVDLKLEIDLKSREYVIYKKEWLKAKQELQRISLPKKEVLCCTYKQE